MTLPPSGVGLLKTRSGVVKIVDKRDRRALVYDLHAATYVEETDVDATASAEWRAVPHVPVYCEECYGVPVPPIALPERGLFAAGVACVFSPEPDPGTKSDGTISREYIAKYTQPLAAARHTAQEAPGEFRFGHSEKIGEVLFYWHVHSRGKVYLNCLATITEKAFAVDVFCASREGGLSLGTWDVGSNHLIKECSLVVVPARPGCRCKIVEGRAAAEALLADLRFGKPKAGVKLAAFEPDAVQEDAPPPSVASKLMLSYIEMMKTYINVLKTCNSHKEVCALEEYIKKGETAAAEDLGPALSSQKLLEASMAQPAAPTAPQQMAAPHPAPAPQPSTSGYHPWASTGFPSPMHAPQYAPMFGPPGGGNYFGWGAPPPQDWTAQYVPTKPKTIAETISDTVAAALTSAMTRNEIGTQKRKAEAPVEPPPAKQPRDETADLTAALREFLAANRLSEGPPPAPAPSTPAPASSLEKELTDLKDLVASMGAAIKTLTAPAEPPPAATPVAAAPAEQPAAAPPESAPVLTAGFSAPKKQPPAPDPKTKYAKLSSLCK